MSSSAKGLAGRYAGALYALAEDAGKVDAVVADLTDLADIVAGNDEMKTLRRVAGHLLVGADQGA